MSSVRRRLALEMTIMMGLCRAAENHAERERKQQGNFFHGESPPDETRHPSKKESPRHEGGGKSRKYRERGYGLTICEARRIKCQFSFPACKQMLGKQ
jgi:hypothetical protein